MSSQTQGTQPQTSQASASTVEETGSTTTTTASVTETVETEKSKRKSTMRTQILSHLKSLPAGAVMTIKELHERMPHVSSGTLQATVSQMVQQNRVVKVKTGKRMPGYAAPGEKK